MIISDQSIYKTFYETIAEGMTWMLDRNQTGVY